MDNGDQCMIDKKYYWFSESFRTKTRQQNYKLEIVFHEAPWATSE